jgi:hypothetical protein
MNTEEYQKLVIGDIIIPIPQITREFDESREVISLEKKDGGLLQIPASDAAFLAPFTNEDTKYLIRGRGE